MKQRVVLADKVVGISLKPHCATDRRNHRIISKETDTWVKGSSCHQTSQAGDKQRQASREDDWLTGVNGGASGNQREPPAGRNDACLASSPPIFSGALWDMFFSPLMVAVGLKGEWGGGGGRAVMVMGPEQMKEDGRKAREMGVGCQKYWSEWGGMNVQDAGG
ncbi:hypothetical protein ElyMa_002261400 [Elysia marginata]|uniref:Uncharacterized protein n=1 Tax=Elysia marginata TaxID=1093978 RepID=A0AAV4FYH3_9GAST|nr:hypothetical protein ElyMa_002261400 [Elysia marginata]